MKNTVNRRHVLALLGAAPVLAACQSTLETTTSLSPDERLQIYKIDSAYRNGDVINTLLVWDRGTHRWVVSVSGHGATWAKKIITNLISPNVVPALIAGKYGIRIAEEGCTSNCGDIINNAASESSASNANDVTITTSTRGAHNPDPLAKAFAQARHDPYLLQEPSVVAKLRVHDHS